MWSKFTCFEFECDVVLVHQIIELSESPEEGVHPLYGNVKEGIPGLITVVDPLYLPLQIQSTTYTN